MFSYEKMEKEEKKKMKENGNQREQEKTLLTQQNSVGACEIHCQ